MQPRPMAETSRSPFPNLRLRMSLLRRATADRRSAPVLFVADLFHPVDDLAVGIALLDGDMGHRGRWRRSVPMLYAGRARDHVTGPDFLDRAAPILRPAKAGRNDQGLTERMRVPGTPGARLKCDAGAGGTCRSR